MGLDYARERMTRLVQTLAVDIRPLPDRLQPVFSYLIETISDAERDSYLPDQLLAEMRDVRDRLTHLEVRGNNGHLTSTLVPMTHVEGYEIAIELLALTAEILALR